VKSHQSSFLSAVIFGAQLGSTRGLMNAARHATARQPDPCRRPGVWDPPLPCPAEAMAVAMGVAAVVGGGRALRVELRRQEHPHFRSPLMTRLSQ